MEFKNMDKEALIFKLLGHETRLKLLMCLLYGSKNVSQLTELVELDQSVVSGQLAKLRSYGVVKSKREGSFVYYSLDEPLIGEILWATEKYIARSEINASI